MILTIAKTVKKRTRNNKGFTLVELMAVLAVLAIIGAIAVPRFTGTINAAKLKADKASALIIARAAEQKWLDDSETGDKTYNAYKDSSNKDAGNLLDYLKEVPEPQNSDSAKGFVADVDENGICTSVKYCNASGTELQDTSNLLD